MPIVVTTMSRQAVSGSAKRPMSAWKPIAGIHDQSVMPEPCGPNGEMWTRVINATSEATSHDATTAQMATRWASSG
jgi:hypothetical protein